MLSDWELWACANKLVEQHGRMAGSHATQRMLELEAEEDFEGHRVWMEINLRVIKLLQNKAGPYDTVQ